MKNIINTSELQRKGLKETYETISKYGEAFLVNQRSKKILVITDKESPRLLINIIKNLKSIKEELNVKYKIKSLAITGSFAKGENTIDSDLDIIIDYKLKDMKIFVQIEELISKTLKIKNIDLLVKENISPFAIESIQKDAIYV